jgi:hypothetical protein
MKKILVGVGLLIFTNILFLGNEQKALAQSCRPTGTYHINTCVKSGNDCVVRNVVRTTSCQRGDDSCRAHVYEMNAKACRKVPYLNEQGDAVAGQFDCVISDGDQHDYWTYCAPGDEDASCCKSNCPAANREGSCTLPSGNAGYNCPKSCESDDDGEEPPRCAKAPRICEEDLVRCVWETITTTKKNGKKVTEKKKVCEYREVCRYGPDPKKCSSPTSCQPTCPSGTSASGTGPLVTTKSCSYLGSTGCEGGKLCPSNKKTVNCYALVSDPPIGEDPIVDHSGTTALGCSASGLTGKEINNDIDIDLSLTDENGVSDIKAFIIWFGTGITPPNVTQIGTGSPLLQSNDSFGFMVGNYNNEWRVFAPRYNGTNPWTWINLNSIGNGERGRIKGQAGLDLAVIKDVGVSDVDSNTKKVVAKLEVLHDESGISGFESADPADYKVFIAGQDVSRWVTGASGTVMAQAPSFTYVQDWTIDVAAPTREDISYAAVSADQLDLNWSFDDSSGVKRVVGDAEVVEESEADGPIDDLTSGVEGYILGSGDNGSETYGGYHLWSADLEERADRIDIRDNEGGSIDFNVIAFDNACNAGKYTFNMELGEPWIITKGGVVFSAGGTDIGVKSFTDHERFSNDSYWSGDFGFYKDESDLSTELLTGGGSSLNSLINNIKLSSVRAQNYNDRNNKSGYWFDELNRRYETMLAAYPERFTTVSITDDSVTFSGSSTDIVDPVISANKCDTNTSCVVEVVGNVSIERNFICDARTTFLVSGNVNIEPDMTASNSRSGCMILAKGDITIGAGTHKSGGSTYPKYDLVEGFFVADGQILIPEVDQDEDVRDGLKVTGSLVAFGGGTGKSISMGRTLKLIDNNAFPAVAVHFDNRYLNFATTVFGGQTETFKREVGFKPL